MYLSVFYNKKQKKKKIARHFNEINCRTSIDRNHSYVNSLKITFVEMWQCVCKNAVQKIANQRAKVKSAAG